MRRFLPILFAPLLLSAPAYAVSNGADADLARTPFIAKINGCTGTLVAADRILTAAHCVDQLDPTGKVAVLGGEHTVAVRGYARVRGYELQFPFEKGDLRNATAVDDVGLVLLGQPVTGIAPVALASDNSLATPGRRVEILGYGQTAPPRPDTPPVSSDVLQTGIVDLISRAACSRAYPGAIGARELCGQDLDGKPIVQPCSGDSGGPLLAREGDRFVQLGVLSWGSEVKGGKCGTHDRPGVWMRVAKYRSFITDDVPVAPYAQGTVTVTGDRTLTCTGPRFGGTRSKISFRWATTTHRGQLRPELAHRAQTVASGRTFTPPASLRGKKLVCGVKAVNRSGEWEAFSRNHVV